MVAIPLPHFKEGETNFEEWFEVINAFVVSSEEEISSEKALALWKLYAGIYICRLLKTLPVMPPISVRRDNVYKAAVRKLKKYFKQETNVFLERNNSRYLK